MKLVRSILKGDARAAARLMTMIEQGQPGVKAMINALRPHTSRAHRIGITGFPGTGKSTLIDQLIEKFRRQHKSVGVVAVDVSSPLTSGAILGDRIRMKRHATDKEVFIRSMANRGHLGGLARKTLEIIEVMEAMGKDVILIETVGVGQAEVEVAKVVHTTVVVIAPGLGDDIQAMKAGLLEVGHLFVINKSDLPGADETEKFLKESLNGNSRKTDWHLQVYKTVALKGEGIDYLMEGISAHRKVVPSTSKNPNLKVNQPGG